MPELDRYHCGKRPTRYHDDLAMPDNWRTTYRPAMVTALLVAAPWVIVALGLWLVYG